MKQSSVIDASLTNSKDEFLVVDGKAKLTKGKERRVFLFEKIIIFSKTMTREGGLPAYKYIHSMKVDMEFIACSLANNMQTFQ